MGGDNMRTDYCSERSFLCILEALMPENRLALLVSMTTGLRISDVLNLRTKDLQKERFTIRELKTGKTRRVRLGEALRAELLAYSGKIYVFENRLSQNKPRTRQAVYKDLKRACECYRVNAVNIAPHSARKIYSVAQYKRTCSVERVKELLNHSDEAVTMLYALADAVTEEKAKKRKVHLPMC